MKKIITSIIATSIFAQIPMATAQTISNGLPSLEVSAKKIKVNKTRLITQAAKEFQKNIHSSNLTVNQAVEQFTNVLLESDVTTSDLERFVRMNSTTEEFLSFREALNNAERMMGEEEMTPEEFGSVAGAALSSIQTEGLAWSGCGGLTAGVIIIIGAVAVGIIALTKTAGEERIRARYDRKRANREDQYLADVQWINNRANELEDQINDLNGKIDYAQNQIAYLTGQMVNEDSQEQRESIAAQIQQYNRNINTYQTEISKCDDERALYSDSAYRAQRIAEETRDFDYDIAQLFDAEEKQVDLIPANKQLAKTLGIVSGVMAAIGTYFAIDGAQDC